MDLFFQHLLWLNYRLFFWEGHLWRNKTILITTELTGRNIFALIINSELFKSDKFFFEKFTALTNQHS